MKTRLFSTFFLFLAGCGIGELAEETKDATKDTLHQVEVGNDNQLIMLELQAKMLEQIQKSNNVQNQLLAAVTHSNSLMELIARLNGQIRDLNEKVQGGVAKAADAVHLQIIGNALEQMFKAENTVNLKPPTRMMPFADALAQEASASEIMSIAHLLIMDGAYGSGSTSFKAASLTGAGAIAGFTALAKTKEIFTSQVEIGGIYEDSAYNFGMVRYMFIRDVFFLPIIEKLRYLNKALLVKAVGHYKELKHLATLPYVDRIELVIGSLWLNEQLDSDEIGSLASRAKSRFQSRLSADVLSDPEVQSLMQELR